MTSYPAFIENIIDTHVGKRLRLARLSAGMSQAKLGRMLGVTFQQVQKIELATNRIGAGRLYQVARILNVSVDWFYQDLPENFPDEEAQIAFQMMVSK